MHLRVFLHNHVFITQPVPILCFSANPNMKYRGISQHSIAVNAKAYVVHHLEKVIASFFCVLLSEFGIVLIFRQFQPQWHSNFFVGESEYLYNATCDGCYLKVGETRWRRNTSFFVMSPSVSSIACYNLMCVNNSYG